MADEYWKNAKAEIGSQSFTLGPYFAFQALNNPRHLLFTLARYKFAAKMLPWDIGVDVLELGCGEGLGTLMLYDNRHRVVAVDFDEDAIAHARSTIKVAGINFRCENFLGKIYGKFQAVVSLDVIEHISSSKEDLFVQTICKNIDQAGFAIVGTPNESAKQYASKASEIGHVNLFSGERLVALFRRYFQNVFIFGMNDEVLHTGFLPMCHYLIALCCGKIWDGNIEM